MEEQTLLDYDLTGDDLEFVPAPADTETRVRIARTAIKTSSVGNNLQVIMELPDFPDSEDIFYTVWLPQPNDTPTELKRKKLDLRKFYQAFSIDFSGPVDYKTDLPGATGWAIVGQEEYNGILRNKIKSFVIPK